MYLGICAAWLNVRSFEDMLDSVSFMLPGMFFYDRRWVVAVFVDVERSVIWFHVWFVFSSCEVHCNVQEVCAFVVGLH